MSEKEKVEGYVEHIIFRNEENGYTVLNLSMKGRELTCVGTLPMIGEGELIEASGDYIEHAAYGKQFRIESYETKVPQDSVALERYLGSGAIKGVGAALAARIVRRFGDDTLRIIEEEPERLAEVKGISERKAREIAQQVAEKAEMQNAMIFLSGYGIALNLGAKIYIFGVVFDRIVAERICAHGRNGKRYGVCCALELVFVMIIAAMSCPKLCAIAPRTLTTHSSLPENGLSVRHMTA